MKWVNATLGMVLHPPAIQISSDKKSLEGLLYARVFNGFYQAAKVDLKIVPISGDYGRCAEGGVDHTGAYKTLLTNETNLGTIMLDNLQCDDLLDIEVGPLQLDYEQTMASLRDPKSPPDNETADFTEIFKTVDLAIYILYIIVLLIVFKLWKFVGKREKKREKKLKRRKTRKFDEWAHLGAMREQGEHDGNVGIEDDAKKLGSDREEEGVEGVLKKKSKIRSKFKSCSPEVGWQLTTISFNQFTGNPQMAKLRLIVLVFILFIFWIFQFLFASFTSNLSVEKPVKYIDSLEDLANDDNNYTAAFISEYNAWRRFNESKDPIIHKVWQKAFLMHGKNGTVLKLDKSNEIFGLLDTKRVGISVRAVTRFAHLMQCAKYDPDTMKMSNFSTVHQATDPLLSSIKVMVAFGPSLSSDARRRLTWAYRIFTENGISTYYDRNPQGIFNLIHSGQVQCVMAVENMKSEEQTSQDDPQPLKPANFKSFTWMCTSLCSIGTIILVYERKWKQLITEEGSKD